MRKAWVGAGLMAVGAVLAATLGTEFIVGGFALIFVGALVLAVALETLVGAAPSTAAAPRAGPDVDARTPGVASSSARAS